MMAGIPMVHYNLVSTHHEHTEIPSITINVSGASKTILYTLSTKSHFQGKITFSR